MHDKQCQNNRCNDAVGIDFCITVKCWLQLVSLSFGTSQEKNKRKEKEKQQKDT